MLAGIVIGASLVVVTVAAVILNPFKCSTGVWERRGLVIVAGEWRRVWERDIV